MTQKLQLLPSKNQNICAVRSNLLNRKFAARNAKLCAVAERVAAIGVLTGAALSLVLSYNLVMGGGIDENTQFESFVVPWSNVAFFIIAALIAAAPMTWIPARQASCVPIADALR